MLRRQGHGLWPSYSFHSISRYVNQWQIFQPKWYTPLANKFAASVTIRKLSLQSPKAHFEMLCKMSNDWYIYHMYPVLVNIGNLQVSTFGLFLALGIFFGGFAVWRIARGYELDSEKVLDLSFLTVGVGFIAARLVHVLSNLAIFDSPAKIFFLNTYPGLSFWGGFIGGLLTLAWLARKNRIGFLAVGDFGIVGFFLAAFFAEIGCLLGGCGVGIESDQFFAVTQVGVIGRRFPVQFFEGLIFLYSFFRFWKSVLKFHVEGSLLAKGLILLGLVKIVSGFFKEEAYSVGILGVRFNLELVVSAIMFGLGLRLYYGVYRKTPFDDLGQLWKLFSNRKTQTQVMVKLSRGWYNHWVNLWIRLGKGKKRLFKFLHIKPNPDNF